MSDIMSQEERSHRMSLIRSKWTSPEKWMHNYLKGNKIKHIMHPKVKGSPDILIPEKRLAIFIHGCFWHGCKKHSKIPQNNKEFWENKIKKNKERDKKNLKELKKQGLKTLTIWECEIPRHHPHESLKKIIKALQA